MRKSFIHVELAFVDLLSDFGGPLERSQGYDAFTYADVTQLDVIYQSWLMAESASSLNVALNRRLIRNLVHSYLFKAPDIERNAVEAYKKAATAGRREYDKVL